MDQRRNDLSKTDDSTSYHQPETPRLCARGCGFFGNPATQNLCSKCYRDFLQEEKDKQAGGLFLKNLSPANCTSLDFSVPNTDPFPCSHASSTKTETSATAGEENLANSTVKKNRCHSCNKKIGLLGFVCRCGPSFCNIHRYPEAHACKFDFKSAGRVAIAKENPLCKADKLQNRL